MKTQNNTPDFLINMIFEKDAVRTRDDIVQYLKNNSVSNAVIKEIENRLIPLKNSNEFTSRTVIDNERAIEAHGKKMISNTLASLSSMVEIPVAVDRDIVEEICMEFIAHSKKNDDAETRARVHAGLMQSQSRLVVLGGAPGTAKSTTALELMKAYRRHRMRHTQDNICDYNGLWVLAINPFAMEKWRERAGVQGATLDQILTTDEMGITTIPNGAFVVVDEAGLIGTERMSLLLQKAVEGQWQKLVLMGDIKQDSPQEYGQPLAYFIKEFPQISFELKTPFRQKNKEEQQFVQQLYDGNCFSSFKFLCDKKRIKIEEKGKITCSVAYSLGQWRKKGLNKMKQCLVLVQDNDMILSINQEIMEYQRSIGVVTDAYPYDGHLCTWQIGKGDRVMLQQSVSFIKDCKPQEYGRGSLGTVVGSNDKEIKILLDRKTETSHEITISRDVPYLIAPAYALTFAQAQGIAADITIVIITKPINGSSMISACSRHRYHCELYIDKSIYSSIDELVSSAQIIPIKRMPYLERDV